MKKARGSTRARTFGLVAMSAGLHLIVFTMLGFIPSPSQVLAMRDIEMEVVEPEPEAPPPPPPPPAPEPPPPEPERKAAPKPQAAPEPTPPPEQAAPPPEEVADFTGETLTAEGGANWATAVGSGAAMKGPVGKIGPRPAPVEQSNAKAAPAGPRFVPVQSLARKPQAPAGLSALLERNFPRRARLQGVEGKAQVRVRIQPNGKLSGFRVLDESPQGFDFGSACVETLRQSPPFIAPLDRSGVAVETEINFSCTFEVAY